MHFLSDHITLVLIRCDVMWSDAHHFTSDDIPSHHITSHQMISDDITSNDIRWYHIISDDIRCFYIPTPVPLIVFCLKEMLNIGWISLGRYLIVGRYLLHTPLDITGYPPQQQSIFGRYHITSDNIWWYKLKSEDIWWYQKISEDIYIRWYLRISDDIENIRWYLRISDDTWWYQRISDDIWGYQRISVDIWGYPRISKDIWGYQRISLDVWSDIIYFHLKSSYIHRYSQISPDISDILLCVHMCICVSVCLCVVNQCTFYQIISH